MKVTLAETMPLKIYVYNQWLSKIDETTINNYYNEKAIK